MGTEQHIINIIGTACTAIVFVHSGIPLSIKKLLWGSQAIKRRLKPFDCEMCMAWWLGIISSIFLETETTFLIYRVVEAVFTGAIASVLAIYITKKLNE